MKKSHCKNLFTFAPFEWPIYPVSLQQEAFNLIFTSYSSDFNPSVIVGINECIDQKGEIEILFVCKEDAKPSILVQHLPAIAYVNNILLVTLPEGSSVEVGNLFANDHGVKRVLCFAVRKGMLPGFCERIRDIFHQFLSFPSIKLPDPVYKRILVDGK